MPRKRPPSASSQDPRAGLFAAVKQAPDDDTPRLILADWLEEYGDEDDRAHAELIRVQCAILRRSAEIINPDNPEPIHSLFRAVGYHTSTLLHHFTHLTALDEHLISLRQREKTLIQGFGNLGLTAPPHMNICEWHCGFASVSLWHGPFRSRELAAFAASPVGPRIETLHINLTPSSLDRIARNPVLAHAVGLEVWGLNVRNAALLMTTFLASSRLAGLRRVERLHAGDTVSALEQAPQRERLTHLYLHSTRLDPDRLRGFAGAGWPSLQVLHLGGSRLGPQGGEALASGPFLAHLRELDLTNCGLQDEGMEALVRSPHFRCPVLLEVDINAIGFAGLSALLAAPGLERLTVLVASRNALSDEAIAALAGCPRLTNLVYLSLGVISEDGARALLQSRHLRRLTLAVDTKGLSAGTRDKLRERYFLPER